MDVTLTRFVSALRKTELSVSPAETLDAMAVVRHVGIEDPVLLRDALRLTLAKTPDEKQRFDACFERFFEQFAFRQPAKQSFFRQLDKTAALVQLRARFSPPLYEVVQAVFTDQREALALTVQRAAKRAGIDSMRNLRDKSTFAAAIGRELGIGELEQMLRASDSGLGGDLAAALRYVRHYISEQLHDYVDTQYRLNVDASGKKAIIDAALKANLTHLPPGYEADMERVVKKIADRLSKEHRQRRRRSRRGQLDIKRTIRHNLAYDGAMFDLHWRRNRRERATVFAICDVSGSVSRVARFLLLLLYQLSDVLPNVRTFAFSSELAEVTDVFRSRPVEAAVEEVLFDWGRGNTDYGRALSDFRELALDDVNRRSTVIILGDARNNYYDPKSERLKEIALRARQVLWLNPENPDNWGAGDSEMPRYAPHCFRVSRCNSLRELEHFADALVAAQR
jgi:uncharacterized protein